MSDRRRIPFVEVPRRWLYPVVVAGGVAGLLLGQNAGWSDVETFLVTLGLAGGGVVVTAFAHRALTSRRPPASERNS
jgi:hypothetical protein